MLASGKLHRFVQVWFQGERESLHYYWIYQLFPFLHPFFSEIFHLLLAFLTLLSLPPQKMSAMQKSIPLYICGIKFLYFI